MPDFAAPLWLLGVAAVILVWWLHLRSHAVSSVPVSALFLWRAARTTATHGRPARRAHPIWMLRAAAVAALLFALSGMSISLPGTTPVVIWVDDSASMATLEDGVPRSRLAIDVARRALHGRPAQLRALSDHTRTLTLDSGSDDDSFEAVRRWPHEGGAPSLPHGPGRDASWWLVTDGANDAVNALVRESRFDRVFVVGSQTENVGIVRLALRRALHQPGQLLGEARVFNAGLRTAHRELRIIASGNDRQADIVDRHLDLEPGAFTDVAFRTDAGDGQIAARLSPGDALPMDDTMTAATHAFEPAKVIIRGACSETLASALAAHPGISIVSDERDSKLTVACAQSRADMRKIAPAAPAIRWYGSPASAMRVSPTKGQWLAWSHRSPDSWFLYPAPKSVPRPEPDASVILRRIDDNAPIVTSRDAYTDVHLELAPESNVGATLKLVGGVLDAATGRVLLDPVVTSTRDATQIRIAQKAPPPSVQTAGPGTKASDFVATPLFLGLALALMVVELIILAAAGMGAARGAA